MRLECEKLEEWVVKTPQGDKRFVMSNHFVKGFAVGFGLGVILMVVAVVSYFS